MQRSLTATAHLHDTPEVRRLFEAVAEFYMYTHAHKSFLISFGSTLRDDPAVPAEVIGVLRAKLGAVRSAPLVLQGQHARRARGVGVFAHQRDAALVYSLEGRLLCHRRPPLEKN